MPSNRESIPAWRHAAERVVSAGRLWATPTVAFAGESRDGRLTRGMHGTQGHANPHVAAQSVEWMGFSPRKC